MREGITYVTSSPSGWDLEQSNVMQKHQIPKIYPINHALHTFSNANHWNHTFLIFTLVLPQRTAYSPHFSNSRAIRICTESPFEFHEARYAAVSEVEDDVLVGCFLKDAGQFGWSVVRTGIVNFGVEENVGLAFHDVCEWALLDSWVITMQPSIWKS